MARRGRKNGTRVPSVLVALFWLLLFLLLLRNPSVIFALVLGLGTLAAAVVVLRIVLPAHRRRSLMDKASAVIDQNVGRLARRRAQLVREDAYGKPVLEGWIREIDYFIDRHIKPALAAGEQSLLRRERVQIAQAITQRIECLTRDVPTLEGFSDDMTPTQFEAFCAEQVRQSGWDARVTQQSRDQGVDVIAEKNGVRLVLQCKLYSRPVGNRAVQEAVAARAFERARYCAVVSNSSYTSAAEQLASTNGVLLLHYSDLKRIEILLG